jgi:hypothetical protein
MIPKGEIDYTGKIFIGSMKTADRISGTYLV